MSFIIKQELHQLIDKCNDESLLEDAKLLFQEQDPSYDWWDDLSEEDKKRGQYQNLNTLPVKDGEKRIVWLKDVSFPVALITKIFKN